MLFYVTENWDFEKLQGEDFQKLYFCVYVWKEKHRFSIAMSKVCTWSPFWHQTLLYFALLLTVPDVVFWVLKWLEIFFKRIPENGVILATNFSYSARVYYISLTLLWLTYMPHVHTFNSACLFLCELKTYWLTISEPE